MKRSLAILLAALMLIGVLPISASAAETDTEGVGVDVDSAAALSVPEPVFIRDVVVNGFQTPVAGNPPIGKENLSVGTWDNPAHYSVFDVDWMRLEEGGVFQRMQENERFESGRRYSALITLRSDYDDGYRFEYTGERGLDQFDSVTINGEASLADPYRSYVNSGDKYFQLYVYDKSGTLLADNPHGTTGECEWEYDPVIETLTISGSGYMRDYCFVEESTGELVPARVPWEDYTDTMRAVVIGKGVKNVGDFAFQNSYELETAEIGTDVEIIGRGAFERTNIHEIDLSQSVTAIGESAFEWCHSLSSVKLSPFISSIDLDAFSETALTEFTVPNADVALAYGCFGRNRMTIYGYDGSTAQ